jgi:D-alanyl-D-alanine carboxypeptidase/D-alanyl-D-alanine-endopeptidase (penicillin-binding protein 4)
MDDKSNLKIKGYGDPLLISEIVDDISHSLAARIGQPPSINHIIADDSFFTRPLTIPGISSSTQPYDAPNGALCVNFNTVFFKRTSSGYASAEEQTPLLPFAEKKIRSLNPKDGRVVLSRAGNENTIYAGLLFDYFLKRNGVQTQGDVKIGRVDTERDRLLWRYVSRFSVSEIIAKLLEFSNNFTTNQLLIACGVKKYGPPGNLANGIAALKKFAASNLQLHDLTIVEGSGISRENRVTARQMMQVLVGFEGHRHLLQQKGRDCYKTGTLYGINTRAGYIESGTGEYYRYVVMINTRGKSTRPVMRKLLQVLE